MSDSWRELNRLSWDERVPIHARSRLYDVAGFKAGRSSLVHGELEALDVAGKSLVHLQCHFGLDTLSFARAGADVTGLDFSSVAIETATQIAREIDVPARFVVADVYDAADALGATYDIVYSGIGAICWLPDVDAWARVVASLLKPGGEFYFVEFHPLEWIWGEDFTPTYDYFTDAAGLRLVNDQTYAGDDKLAHTETVQWNHSLGAVVTALARAGLSVTSLAEHDATMVKGWDFLVERGDGLYAMPSGRPNLPFMYTLRAAKG
ncbi:MAG: class I SAM-dependent methyltransferase [Alphaproteobacteria bacterium]|nr:class I SAM-dependent methyltransferase [Alphaproteobacteria bacterium]MBO6628620.1 class I SAM-dependent methyltransferase [Alphaproteobacteria bacterium]MDF1626839.1 class I SAM-dependent methyltransferase [Parvibaculaceae bacterium]